MLRKFAPKSLLILMVNLSQTSAYKLGSDASNRDLNTAEACHKLVESLELWASPKEIAAFANGCEPLDDKMRTSFLDQLTLSSLRLCVAAQDIRADSMAVRVLPCKGCSTVVDGGDCCRHGDSPPVVFPEVPSDGTMATLARALHINILHVALAVNILNWQAEQGESSVRFLQMCAEESPADLTSNEWSAACLRKGEAWRIPLSALTNVIQQCAIPFPKAANMAATLVGLIVTTRPAASLSLLDPILTVDCVFKCV
jgi:hypothetical protein